MRILKANTAVRLVVGPLCDKTTGLAKTGMTVTNMAMNMWHEHDDGSAPTKSIDAVSFTASGGNNDMVELAGGYYDIEITATQTNITAGRCGFCIYDDDVILPYFEEWLIVPANVFDSIMGTDKLDVNAAELGGTSQTGRDVGASVLLSSGTGTGQLDFTAGVVKANLAQILGTVLTETAGQIAAAFKKFFDKASPTGTINSLPDAVPGASGGLPTQNGTKLLQTVDLTAGQSIAANGGTVTNLTNLPAATADWLTANAVKADAVTKIQNGLALEATLTAIKGADWSTETLAAIDVLIAAIKAKTDNLPASPAATGAKMDLIDAPNSTAVTAIQNGLSKPGTAQTISSNSDISAIKLKTDNLPSDPADQSAVEAAISAIPAGISAEDVMTAIVEGAITLRDSLKLHNAFVAGKVSGGGTESISFRDLADTLDRILMTVDTSGNRTDVTKDLSDD